MDEIIDRALKTYAAREPSAGLEARILAHAHAPRRRWTPWLLVGGTALAAGAAFFTITPHPQNVTQALPPVHAIEATSYLAPKPIPPVHHHRRRPPEPKLAVFPSPAPIPEAEIALAHALSANPELSASLLAQSAQPEPAAIAIRPLSIKALDED